MVTFDAGIAPVIEGEHGNRMFPVKVYEYIACGLPVIVSSNREAGHFIEENNIGIFVAKNEVQRAIDYLVFLKKDRDAGRKIREKTSIIARQFDRKKISKTVIRQILNSE